MNIQWNFIVFVCFFFKFQLAYGRVAREAPTSSPIDDAFKLANETFEAFHKSFLNIAGVKSDDEFWAKSKSNFDTFQNTITSTAKDLNEQTKPLQTQTQDLVKAFVAKITEVGEELKAKNPELFSGDAKKLQVSNLIRDLFTQFYNRMETNSFFFTLFALIGSS